MTLCSSKTAKGPFGFIATIREGREREREKREMDGKERRGKRGKCQRGKKGETMALCLGLALGANSLTGPDSQGNICTEAEMKDNNIFLIFSFYDEYG